MLMQMLVAALSQTWAAVWLKQLPKVHLVVPLWGHLSERTSFRSLGRAKHWVFRSYFVDRIKTIDADAKLS